MSIDLAWWWEAGQEGSAPGNSFRLWPSVSGPAAVTADTAVYTLGMEFTLAQPCALNKIWFWSAPGAGVLPSAVVIFLVSTLAQVPGTLITSPAWSGPPGSGWVSCSYATPPGLAANTNYRVAVFGGDGVHNMYSVTPAYWTTGAGGSNLTTGPVTAYQSSLTDVGQDSFDNSGHVNYPSNSGAGNNYWIDLTVTPQFPSAATTGPAAGGFTPVPTTAADIPLGGPYPPFVTALGGGAFLVQNCAFTGGMNCFENNVTFQGCTWAVNGPSGFALSLRGTGPYVVNFCRFTGQDANDSVQYCVFALGGNATIENSEFYWSQQPLNLSGNGYTVTGNYIHDLVAPAGAHDECIILQGGNSNVNISQNTLLNPVNQTAVAYITPNANYSNVSVQGNLIAGGGWSLYCGGGTGTVTGMSVSGNAFSTRYYPQCGFFGTDTALPASGFTWSGNYWYDGASQGMAVSP